MHPEEAVQGAGAGQPRFMPRTWPMQVVDRSHIRLRVYERGVGETLACGPVPARLWRRAFGWACLMTALMCKPTALGRLTSPGQAILHLC